MTLPLIKPCHELDLFMASSKSRTVDALTIPDSQKSPNGRTKSRKII